MPRRDDEAHFPVGGDPLGRRRPARLGAAGEIAALRAELAKQQAVIDAVAAAPAGARRSSSRALRSPRRTSQEEIKAQEDSVNSLREIVNSKVNLNGYYNFRFSVEDSDEPTSFQQHHLGVMMAKQLGKFNFLMELELQNVPHHPEIYAGKRRRALEKRPPKRCETDISGEGQVAVENAWMEYNHNRFFSVRFGKQLSPQYWWQNHYPNLTLSTTLPIYLRELFPAELVGVMVQGSAGQSVGTSELGVGYKFYVANNNFEGNSRGDLRDGKAWGARGQVRFPTGGRIAAPRCCRRRLSRPCRLDDQRARGRQRVRFRRSARSVAAFCFRRNGPEASRSSRRERATTCSRRSGSMKTGSRSIASSSS